MKKTNNQLAIILLTVLIVGFCAYVTVRVLKKHPTSLELKQDSAKIVADGPKINQSSEFASACPYCGIINVSQTCLMNGGYTTNSVTLQQWNINYVCRGCNTAYSDFRQQVLKNVRSIMLNQ